MPVEIRRTTVTPTANGSVVHVHISDAPLEAPAEEIELQMTVSLPKYGRAILIEEAQRAAMRRSQRVLTGLLQQLMNEIHRVGIDGLNEELA